MAFGSASQRSIQLSYGCSQIVNVSKSWLERNAYYSLPTSSWQLSRGYSCLVKN